MEEKMNIIKNKISRKNFFITTAIAGFGLVLLKSFPFRFLQSRKRNEKIRVKINPLAVSRKNIGGKNV